MYCSIMKSFQLWQAAGVKKISWPLIGHFTLTAMNQADTRWQYSDSSEAYVNFFKRPANVSSRSRLEIWTSWSRLG